MSESSRTEDSAPSLSSYPPAFLGLITTFIKRAEEAETRAHKALVILRAKDEQVLELQKRLDVLEKIASRLEEVMVPPLILPQSPDEVFDVHPRDCENASTHQPSNPCMEVLYERHGTIRRKGNPDESEVHNCYARCQHLIEGLERSNCQLRKALTAESAQRVQDHEQYVATLATVTEAVTHLQPSRLPNSICEEVALVLRAAGDTKNQLHGKEEQKQLSDKSKEMVILDKEYIKTNLDMAEKILKTMYKRLETQGKKYFKRSKTRALRKIEFSKASRSSTSSYHTPVSSTSLKPKPKYRSWHCFFTALKKKNKKLKLKNQHIYEKFKESVNLCGKLKEDLISLTEQNKRPQKNIQLVESYTQTEKNLSSSSRTERQSTWMLQGRLDAAAQVMASQSRQVQELRRQLADSHGQIHTLKTRLSRAESSVAAKDQLMETVKSEQKQAEEKNAELVKEIQQLKDSINHLTQEVSNQREINSKLELQKGSSEQECDEIKRAMETKLCSLSSTLQQKEELSNRATSELESKLNSLREQFVAQISEAGDRLVAADSKIQELYLGIEIFLKLLFSISRSSTSPELSPASHAQAVQVASDILQLAPAQIHTILHSSRRDHRASMLCGRDSHLVNKWIKDCNRLIHNKVFAKSLGHFLLDAVLEAKIS